MIINKKQLSSKQLGFSLVEAIVYLAIVGILLTAVVTLHLTLGGTYDKLSSNILASRNRRMAMGGIDYLIKNSDGLLKDVEGDCSSFNATPPVLALYFKDDNNLPGTCVENGGGVRISIEDKKVSLTCHPNMSGNGYYQNCNTAVYPPGNIYYLSSSDVAILDSSLDFSTSTATSTANGFLSISTNLSVSTHSSNQIRLSATSTATSTLVLKNEQANGLVAWYKFDDDDSMEAVDSAGDNDLECDSGGIPTRVSGLVDGSGYAFDFSSAEGDKCITSDVDVLNFSNSFTFASWIETDFESGSTQNNLIDKGNWGTQEGYLWTVYSDASMTAGRLWLRILDGNGYSNTADSGSYILNNGSIYHMTHVYDSIKDTAILYLYEKGVGMVNTTTKSGVPTLVNYNDVFTVSNYFDGTVDELRIYNRALTNEEVWALQSQGAN